MKIAICLHGLHPDESWKDVKKQKDKCLYYLNKNIININNINNCDIFLHSFSKNKENELLMYQPKDKIIETDYNFDKNNEIDYMEKTYYSSTKNIYGISHVRNVYYYYYGIKKCVQLMSDYEKKYNFQYDFVMTFRIDCCFIRPLDFNLLEKNKFYSSNWGKDNFHGKKNNNHLGYWFISNSDLIKKLSTLYDNLYNYIEKYKFKYISAHELYGIHIDTFCNEIIYKFNDIDGNPIDHDLQRYLVQRGII